MANPGDLPLLINPLKTTTAGIYEGCRREAERLRKRLRDLARETPAGWNEGAPEAEGLRSRLRALHELLAEAVVLNGNPEAWRRETAVVRLGSRITLEMRDGEREFLFIGLAGPMVDEHVLTPGTPLGAAVLGRRVGETVTYRTGREEFKAVIRRCLMPGESPPVEDGEAGRLRFIAAADEIAEANHVAFAIEDLRRAGLPPDRIAVAWRAPYQSWALEKTLAFGGVPHRIEEGGSFFGQPLVAGMLGLMRLLIDPGDAPARAAVSKAFGAAGGGDNPSWGEAGDQTATACEDPVAIVSAREELRGSPPVEVIRKLTASLGFTDMEDPFRSPWPCLYQAATPHQTVRSFLAHTEEIRKAACRGDRRGVRLAPLPRLGTGYGALFIIGANEGAMPFDQAEEALPMERALFYAAIAAAERVTVSWTRQMARSRLLLEIADEGMLR